MSTVHLSISPVRALVAAALTIAALAAAGCGESAATRAEGLDGLQSIRERVEAAITAAHSPSPPTAEASAAEFQRILADLRALRTSACLADAKRAVADGLEALIADTRASPPLSEGGVGMLAESIQSSRFEEISTLCKMSEADANAAFAERHLELEDARANEERTRAEETAGREQAIADATRHCTGPRPARSPGSDYREPLRSGASGPVMVVLPCGGFLMGSGSTAHEGPPHPVAIRSFGLSKMEISFEEYDAFAEATGRSKPSDEGWGRGKQPVVNVNWDDAEAYAAWLSQETGTRYRLPSEAEWEYAARAGSSDEYAWGYDIGYNKANCDGCGSQWDNHQPAPVGSFPANAFGLHDMHGNVWEWVQDCYRDSYAGAPADGAAQTVCDSPSKVFRGGSWFAVPSWLRSAHRSWTDPNAQRRNGGFRVAQDLQP